MTMQAVFDFVTGSVGSYLAVLVPFLLGLRMLTWALRMVRFS